MLKEKVIIDGSVGGGSILRISMAFSILFHVPIEIINIRAKRAQPGLKEQHLQGVLALKQICNGKIKGAKIGSQKIEFYPGNEIKKEVSIKIPTAGSVGLVLYPIILASKKFREIKIKINGGATFGRWAPPITFLQNVTFPILKKIGINVSLEIKRHGFYPKGGAIVDAFVEAKEIKPLYLEEFGDLIRIRGISISSKDLKNRRVAERQIEGFLKCFSEEIEKMENEKQNEKIKKIKEIKPEINFEYVDSFSSGSCITTWLETNNTIIGSDALGEKEIKAEDVGKNASKEIIEYIKGFVTADKHLADQIIPFLFLSKGLLIVREITEHIENSIFISQIFTQKKAVIKDIKCNGGECKKIEIVEE
jgi:RNA 3'-terminal phosphate cyclase (GTP)